MVKAVEAESRARVMEVREEWKGNGWRCGRGVVEENILEVRAATRNLSWSGVREKGCRVKRGYSCNGSVSRQRNRTAVERVGPRVQSKLLLSSTRGVKEVSIAATKRTPCCL